MGTKNPGGWAGVMRGKDLFVPVVPDGLDWAAFEGLHALGNFFLGGGLLVNVRVATFVMALEERRGGFATEIAVDALLIDEKLSRGVLGPFISFVRHSVEVKATKRKNAGPVKRSHCHRETRGN